MRFDKRWFPGLLIAFLLLGSYGCKPTGTAAHATGEAVSDTAVSLGHTVGVAAEGVGDIVEKTANAADDEMA